MNDYNFNDPSETFEDKLFMLIRKYSKIMKTTDILEILKKEIRHNSCFLGDK